jgi:hypothetical protein
MLFIFSTPELIRHLWQLKPIVFLHYYLICSVPFDHCVFISRFLYISDIYAFTVKPLSKNTWAATQILRMLLNLVPCSMQHHGYLIKLDWINARTTCLVVNVSSVSGRCKNIGSWSEHIYCQPASLVGLACFVLHRLLALTPVAVNFCKLICLEQSDTVFLVMCDPSMNEQWAT